MGGQLRLWLLRLRLLPAVQLLLLLAVLLLGFGLRSDGHAAQLVGQDPFDLYRRSNAVAGVAQDPCLCDAFIAAVRFMEAGPVRPWWYYTPERKEKIGQS